ncbi:MAG: hypothetical protein LOD91_01335 [Limnochordales bacterium]|nr:hypothetical protein [Limnochordales bacterium]
MAWLIPLVSCVIGAVFTGVLLNQYRQRRRWHQLMWSVGMAMFVLATFGEFYGGAFGWTPFVYKLYYFAGVALPGLLGAGTVYLMTRQRPAVGHVYAAATVLVAVLFLVAVAGAELNAAALATSGVAPNSADILPVEARRPYSLLLSMVGGLVMLGGALYSWLRFNLTYNRQIFLGALVFVLGGMLTSRAGLVGIIPITNLIGVALVFSGVMAAERFRPQAAPARAG